MDSLASGHSWEQNDFCKSQGCLFSKLTGYYVLISHPFVLVGSSRWYDCSCWARSQWHGTSYHKGNRYASPDWSTNYAFTSESLKILFYFKLISLLLIICYWPLYLELHTFFGYLAVSNGVHKLWKEEIFFLCFCSTDLISCPQFSSSQKFEVSSILLILLKFCCLYREEILFFHFKYAA